MISDFAIFIKQNLLSVLFDLGYFSNLGLTSFHMYCFPYVFLLRYSPKVLSLCIRVSNISIDTSIAPRVQPTLLMELNSILPMDLELLLDSLDKIL